jgi:hypothetical protein
MAGLTVVDKFGPADAIKLIGKYFCQAGVLSDFDPKTIKDPRNKLSYGVNQAESQWAKALLDGAVPDPEGTPCFICKLPCTKREEWSSPQVEHLLPSAFAFLLFGLPGKFHSNWKEDSDAPTRKIYKAAVDFGASMRELQATNYKWCHAYCNRIKGASIFIKILRATAGCLDDYGACEYDIYSGDKITLNYSSTYTFNTKLFESPSDSRESWQRKYKGNRNGIYFNIEHAFKDLIDNLSEYDEDTISAMISFNLYVGVAIVCKYLNKPIPMSRANTMARLQGMIQGSVQSGGAGKYELEKLTREEFEDFLRIGEAIAYYSEKPYEGKEADDAYVAKYVVEKPDVNDQSLKRVPAPNANTPRPAAKRARSTRNNNNNSNMNQSPLKALPFSKNRHVHSARTRRKKARHPVLNLRVSGQPGSAIQA